MDSNQKQSLWKASNRLRSPEDFILKKKGKFGCILKSLNCLCDLNFLHTDVALVTVILPQIKSMCEQLDSLKVSVTLP